MADIEYIRKTLEAVADGYEYYINDHETSVFFLVVENPDFKEDDGSDPKLCIMIDKNQEV